MIRLPRACRGRTAVRISANSSHMELALKGLASAGKGLARSLTDYYAVLMSPSKGETAVHMAATAPVIWLCACVR